LLLPTGTLLHLVSLTPGVDGVLTLDGPPGTKIDPDSEQAVGSAVFTVDGDPARWRPDSEQDVSITGVT